MQGQLADANVSEERANMALPFRGGHGRFRSKHLCDVIREEAFWGQQGNPECLKSRIVDARTPVEAAWRPRPRPPIYNRYYRALNTQHFVYVSRGLMGITPFEPINVPEST
jgi:hypothetical protein